jgi:hypothetical protein
LATCVLRVPVNRDAPCIRSEIRASS